MKIKSILITLLISLTFGFLLGTVAGIVIGVKITKTKPSNEKEVITSTIVLERMKDRAFLITRSLISEQETTITIDQGSAWSNFWWGHEVTASGLIQVDIGVDFSKIKEEDIRIDEQNKIIYINVPQAEVYDSSPKSDLEVKTKSGILKKLLKSDSNEDFNLALEALTNQAKVAAEKDESLLKESQELALDTIQVFFNDTGYTVKIMPSE